MRFSKHAEKHAVLKGHYFPPSLLEQTFKQTTTTLSVNGASLMGQGVLVAPAQSGINIPEHAVGE